MSSNKLAYAASTSMTVTNLQSLASSSTLTGGWESAAVDNSSNLYLDYLVAGVIKVGSSPSAGEIRIYAVGMQDDTNWPDVFDGTESTETVTDEEIRDGFCKLLTVIGNDTTTNDLYYFGPCSIAQAFGGVVPRKFVIFVTHSTGVNLASSGNAVYYTPVYTTNA